LSPRCLAFVPFLVAGLGATAGCSGSGGSAPAEGGAGDAGRDAGSKKADARTAEESGATDARLSLPPTLITEPDQGMTPIYTLISSAQHTLDMTMYELYDTTVTGLLTTAAKQGVTVRVILDQNLEMKDNTTAYDALSAGNVHVHWANPVYAATHQKTITVDRTTSAIMTLNLAAEYYRTSRDFAVITTDSRDVAAIESTFDDDFVNASITPPTGDDLVWSPTNAEASLLGVIDGAKSTLLVENEEMSDDAIVSALASAASRGVDVQVVMTASKSWDSEFSTLETAGVRVVTYLSSASLYIHAKVILADYGTSTARVFIGSENFSNASLTKNRELGTILSDPAILVSIQGTLATDFMGGTAYP
jgi:cardiolipin synthase A/B